MPESPVPVRKASTRPPPGARSRTLILDAAEALMAERGYAGTGISAISKRSGLPTSSIYWHFESKEGLLAAVMERGALRWLDVMNEVVRVPGDPEQRLRRLLDRAFSELGEETGPAPFLRLMILLTMERRQALPDLAARIDRVRARFRDLMVGVLRDVFASAGAATAQRVAEGCAAAAMAFGEGCFVAHEIEPEGTDMDALAWQLEIAVMAIGSELLRREDGNQ